MSKQPDQNKRKWWGHFNRHKILYSKTVFSTYYFKGLQKTMKDCIIDKNFLVPTSVAGITCQNECFVLLKSISNHLSILFSISEMLFNFSEYFSVTSSCELWIISDFVARNHFIKGRAIYKRVKWVQTIGRSVNSDFCYMWAEASCFEPEIQINTAQSFSDCHLPQSYLRLPKSYLRTCIIEHLKHRRGSFPRADLHFCEDPRQHTCVQTKRGGLYSNYILYKCAVLCDKYTAMSIR